LRLCAGGLLCPNDGGAGDFFDLVQEADAVRRLVRPLSPHEFKLIFLPWQLRQRYRADPATVLITRNWRTTSAWSRDRSFSA